MPQTGEEAMVRNLWEYEDIVPELQKQGYETDEIVNAIDVLEHAGRVQTMMIVPIDETIELMDEWRKAGE